MPKFSIGDIVTLLTHPFSENNAKIIIQGEHLMTPPTMIVSEIISRDIVGQKKLDSFKCIWFSSKRHHFLDHWFNENEIKKLINPVTNSLAVIEGCQVTLNNLLIELGKRRSYLQIDSNSVGASTKTDSITSHLPFVSPIMVALSITEFDAQKLKKGISLKDKIFPKKLVKCKYFDAASEKFSEVILPIEALLVIPVVSDSLLKDIKNLIQSSGYMKFEASLVRPLNLFNKSGFYLLRGFDVIRQKYIDIELHTLNPFIALPKIILDFAPKFSVELVNESRRMVIRNYAIGFIKEAIASSESKYLLIKYIDNIGIITKRVVDNYEIVHGSDDLESGKMVEYLMAYCNTRKAVRHFKIKSILEVSKLDLDFQIRKTQ